MARIRQLKPEFFLDEDLATQPPLSRILFAGLWTLADREGRLEDRPSRIKVQVLPHDDCNIDQMLSGLHSARFITRYAAKGRKYIQIRTFLRHQHPHIKEPQSTIPAPGKNGARTVLALGKNSSSTSESGVRNLDIRNLEKDNALFEQFWKIYPRKANKPAALKAWRKAKLDNQPELVNSIDSALREQIVSGVFADLKFAPYPASWINGRRWEDEIVPDSRKANSKRREVSELRVGSAENFEQEPEPTPPCKFTLQCPTSWFNFCAWLKVQSLQNYDTWARPLIVLEERDGSVDLEAPNVYIASWWQEGSAGFKLLARYTAQLPKEVV